MTIEWQTDEVELLSTENIYQVEQGAANYFMELLIDPTHSALKDSTEIVSTHVDAKIQTRKGSFFYLQSEIHVSHVGNQGLSDLASLLMFLTNRNTTDSFFTAFDNSVGLGIKIELLSFSNEGDSTLLTSLEAELAQASKYTKSEKTLIISTSLLAFALFVMSIIFIWIAGGWMSLRKQIKVLIHREEEMTRLTRQAELKENPTGETDEEEGGSQGGDDITRFTSASGILGVNPYYGRQGAHGSALDGLGIKMTPARGTRDFNDMDSDIQTPMSDATGFSYTNAAPLGITSMRKLMPAEGDDAVTVSNSLAQLGVKRLQY
jgi:hypothetical protein